MASLHPVTQDTLSAARALQPMLRSRAADIERARRLPADIAEQFARAGFYRMAVPRRTGGPELPAADRVETNETRPLYTSDAAGEQRGGKDGRSLIHQKKKKTRGKK